MAKVEWSPYQQALFKEIKTGQGNVIVEALAGSGKTSSLVESFKYVQRGKKCIALAFNKSIQKELREKAPSYIQDVLTFHSLGLRAVKQRFKNVVIDDYKVMNILKDNGECGKDYNLMNSIRETISYCKYELVDAPDSIEQVMYRFGVDTCGMEQEQFIKIVIKTMATDKTMTNIIDFDDMCWFPFVHNLFMGHYDYVFVDEFQDMNRAQAMMAQRVCRPKFGRFIACGDSKQDLYKFRGSDSSIIGGLKKEPNTTILTLPITYRCPQKIVELVKPWVPNFEASATAKEGEINSISLNEMYKLAKHGCFVLSRVNAPLIKICLSFIRNGKRANIRGRDIGAQLAGLIKKSKKKQIPAFLKWLEKWKNDEVEKLQSRNISVENTLDKYECLVNLCDDFSTLDEVEEKVEELFDDSDEKNVITLSSIHKSKGLERDEVFLLKWTCRGWFDTIFDFTEEDQEMNCNYVGSTRAKNKLFLVNKY